MILLNIVLKTLVLLKKSNICFDADITDPKRLLEILQLIGSQIVICKIHLDIINLETCSNFKEQLIQLSIDKNFLIMEDRKFNDISSIVDKQYTKFRNWVDLITVHSLISSHVIQKLSGVLIVVNMSNNNYDFLETSLALARNYSNNVVGFITQSRIKYKDMVSMTPCISLEDKNVDDQRYRSINNIDTDYLIIGRALYEVPDIKNQIEKIFNIQRNNPKNPALRVIHKNLYDSCIVHH